MLAIGFAVAVDRVGTIFGTQLDYVRDYNVAVPYSIYTVLMLSCAVFIYFLPDTYSEPLQDFCLEDHKETKHTDNVDQK